jgi:outer membrane lipoprotein
MKPGQCIFGIFFLLSACTAAISKDQLQTVDSAITFPALLKNPEGYKGKNVLLGGQIVNTQVKKGETWVEVLQKPLDWQQRPKNTDESLGRFLIRFSDFRDPAIYAPGRQITVLGEVLGKKVLPLKELEYSYPVLAPRESHLWKPEESTSPSLHFGIGVGGIIR